MDGTTNRRRQVSGKRRAMIEPEAFKTLHDGAIDLCYDADSWKSGDVETIKGAVCVAIDSYAIAFPNLPERREQARQAAGGPPMVLASTAYDIRNHLHMDLSIGFDQDRFSRARAHVRRVLGLIGGRAKPLFVFDRGWLSNGMVGFLEDEGALYVFRCGRDDLPKGLAEGGEDDREAVFAGREIRLARFRAGSAPGSGTEVLATNGRDLAIEELGEFYHGLWRTGTSYNTLKRLLKAEDLPGKGWTAVQQDFYAGAMAADMLMMLELESAPKMEARIRAAGGLDGHRAWLDRAVGFYAEGYIQALCLEGAARRDRAMTLLESEMEKEVGRRFSR